MNKARITLAQINEFSREEFTRVLGPLFEHSPWIAEAAWADRPFATREQLHQALGRHLHAAAPERQMALIQAHPDLVGHAALAGTLTLASAGEQAGAGLDRLSAEEIAAFQQSNAAYRERFGFPFIICARLNKKEAILAGFEKRLIQSREAELVTALGEIKKIARLRLEDLVADV